MANTLKIKRGTAATIPQGQLAEPLFTTDTYDLYIGKGAGGNQRIQNYIASGTSSQFLKGDGSLDSNTYQTALTFSSPLVNTSGTISIPAATSSVNGYLTSTDWTTFNSKEPAITAGTTLQYYRGDKTFQTLDTSVVPENGPIYFTEPRVRATVLTGLNLSGGGTIAATDSVLTAFGKVQNQISALVGGATYQGTWNASTNTPTLASGTGTKGYYYVVSVAGSTNLDGITDWKIGDWAIFNGTTWDKVDNTDAVSSVNGFTGAVNLALDNISDVSAASPTNAQLLRFNGTSSLWENWTPTFEPALTKGNLTEATSSVLTITGGTGAVIGSGTTIAVAQASGSTSGYLSSTDWTTFNNKQAALTNPVTGTGTNNYIPKFTATGSTIGDSSLYYSQGANSNSYTFGSVGAGAIYNLSQFNIYSNSTSEMFFQWGSNKYLYIGNSSGNVSFSSINTGTHNYNNIIYYNGASASDRYIAFGTEATTRLQIEQNGDIRFNKYTSNGFVKTSSANGTITIDTTSYLPLTGGTLTGALIGTSATFSINQNSDTIVSVSNTTAGTSSQAFFQATSDTTAGYTTFGKASSSFTAYKIVTSSSGYFFNTKGDIAILNDNATGTIKMAAGGSTSAHFTISSTGAATFSSSISATSATFSDTISATKNRSNTAGTVALKIAPADTVVSFGFRVDSATNSLNLDNSYDNTNLFKISLTGAATFSSTVTVTGESFITSGDGAGKMLKFTGGTTKYNWMVAAQQNVNNALEITPSSAAGGSTFSTPAVVITSGGNVGIGTTSPSYKLHVYGVSASNTGFLIDSGQYNSVADTPYTGMYMTGSSSTDGFGALLITSRTDTARPIIFGTSNGTTSVERMRITSGGSVLINETSLGSETCRLYVKQATDADFKGYFVASAAAAGFVGSMSIDSSGNLSFAQSYITGGGSYQGIKFSTSGSERMRITSGGNVEISSGSIKTGAPSGGTAKPWKLGARLSGTVSTSTTNYLEVEVDGTLYYLAFAVPL